MYVKLDLVILLLSIFIGLMQKDCRFVEDIALFLHWAFLLNNISERWINLQLS